MSNNLEAAELNPMTRDGNRSHDYDEIDLIDVIGFFWRSRTLVGSGVVAGLLGAGALWLAKKPTGAVPQAATSQWTATLAANNGDETALAAMPQQLNSFLKTAEGATAFYQGLATAEGRANFSIADWASKQQAGNGLVKNIEINGGKITVTFQNMGHWTESDIKTVLPSGLNNTIAAYNHTYADVQSSLNQARLNLQLQMGVVKIKALQLFDRYAGLSPNMQKTVLEGLMKELASNSKPDSVAFLLAAVPQSESQKTELLAEYKKEFLAYEILESRSKNLAKHLGLETLAPMVALGPINELTMVAAPGGIGSQLLQKLPVLLVLGLILGGMAGTFLALLRAFWTSNRQRLQDVFAERSR